MSMVTIHRGTQKKEYSFNYGDNLLEFLRSKGFDISAPCGGHGLCGKCRVKIVRGNEIIECCACETRLTEDCQVFLPEPESEIFWNGTVTSFASDASLQGLGAAVDLGTTTVAVSLYELASGREIGSLSRWNAQRSYGADVISRIGHCMDNPEGLERLGDLIRGQITGMISELCAAHGRSMAEVTCCILAGNTVMEHIFAGISPESIAAAPYLPESYFEHGEKFSAGGLEFRLSPCVAGYVGGDITAGLLACDISRLDGTALFIDVGTNGEIVLGNKDGYYCCAVASGPAFEGAGISCGMPAADGAIYAVELSGDEPVFKVIGGGEAKGICGSGILDVAAVLLELGYIDESGCLENDDGDDVYYLTDDVYVNQRDIRQLQLAKAALSAGITRLTELSGIDTDVISAVYLAGGFGTWLNSESAVRIGMLPKGTANKVKPLGNTSLAGAAMAMLQPAEQEKLQEIKQKCRYLELSSDKRFNELFVEAMAFPEM